MKLFHSPASPYVRKVVVLLHELGKTDAVVLDTVATTAFATNEGLSTANPLGKLPALQRDDGVTLYDSRVITAYLNDLFDGGLYPQGASVGEPDPRGDRRRDHGCLALDVLRKALAPCE